MKTLSEEKINRNYMLWIEQLKKYNCYSEQLIEEYGESIRTASFGMNETSGSSYVGSMIDVVLYHLCSIANHINENGLGIKKNEKVVHKHLYVDKNSLMKVLLLQHIAKSEMFERTNEQWKINKGMYYEFNPNLETSMKLGERSLYICTKCGISFNEIEYEAMRCLDKEDSQINAFTTPLSALVRIANNLTAIEMFKENKE